MVQDDSVYCWQQKAFDLPDSHRRTVHTDRLEDHIAIMRKGLRFLIRRENGIVSEIYYKGMSN